MTPAKVQLRRYKRRAAHAAGKRQLRHQPAAPLSARDWRLFHQTVAACRQLHQLVGEMERRRRYRDDRLPYLEGVIRTQLAVLADAYPLRHQGLGFERSFDLWASNVLQAAGIPRLHWRPRRLVDRLLDPALLDAYVDLVCGQMKKPVEAKP
jgi:hypothetical protein